MDPNMDGHTGGSPFLVSPATGRAMTPSASYGDKLAAEAGDAGAEFVLESKGTWWHAGFHLTTAMVGPTVLTLPYALRGMGWALGLAALTAVAAVTFYTYYLMSRVLDHCEASGRRHIRFCELAADVLGTYFGDIVGVVGAVGFIPLDFVLPVVMYNMALAPPTRSAVYVINVAIMALFTGVGIIGAIASVRKLVLDAGQFKLFSDHVIS